MIHARNVLALAALLALGACDSGPPTPDSSVPMVDGGLAPSSLFGPCVEDWQCPGEGAICRGAADGWLGGFCTVPCVDRTPCDQDGIYHHCVRREGEAQSYCERRCLNGLDCRRDNYTCEGEGDYQPSGGACFPVCSSDDQCGAGTICDPHTGLCTSDALPTTGGVSGDPCDAPSDCRSGACIPETNATGVPTGWIHGYCVGNCVLPRGYNSNTYFDGDALPAATCPGDAVCLPAGSTQSRGDLGTCYDQCTSNGDCREGYGCLQQFGLQSGGTASFSNGLCVPANCQSSGCPTGYECVTVTGLNGQPRAVCARQ
ncbi:MAG: hypothetical protein IT378_09160 [Sandaracinaceae bacterium]|nr:hypothetical protein [Sandaracinaceae bacterium]